MGPTRTARAGFYTFTGTITSVDDPFGAFSNLAALGAPVSGTFGYSDPGDYFASSFVPSVTVYTNERSDRPELTGLALNINGVAQRSDAFSLTNLDVGDNVPIGAPFFPAGDFFRYFDGLATPPGTGDDLVDYSKFSEDSFAVPDASITLLDPTGLAFASQDLPRGVLPLSALTDRYGEFSFYDGNGEDINYGSIGFRIDSIQSVPEPGSLVLLASAAIPGAAMWLLRRRTRRSFFRPRVV